MEIRHRTELLGLLVALAIAGCATPGPFATHYQQSTLVPSASVSSVTLLRLTDEAEQQMLAGNVVLVGTSQFETDHVDRAKIEAEAKTQADKIGANVVILHQRKVYADTRTREKTVKTDWQKGLEENDTSFEKDSFSSSTQSGSSVDDKGVKRTKTKTKSSSVHVGGSLAGLGRALGGEKTVQEEYQVDIYEVRATFVRNPTYPGLD